MWREFIRRFNRYIALVITQECRHLQYQAGLNQIDDIISNVYLRLIDNNCKALKRFKGKYKNSIFNYLKIIAIRMVHIHYDYHRRKGRMPEGGFVSLDETSWDIHTEQKMNLLEILPDKDWENKINIENLISEIDHCLDKILEHNRNAPRDKFIFKLYHFKDFDVAEIAQIPGVTLSEKRISNLISELKIKVRACLRAGRFFD